MPGSSSGPTELLQVAAVRQAKDLPGAGDVAGCLRPLRPHDVEDVELYRVVLHGEATGLGEVVAADPPGPERRACGPQLLAVAADTDAAVHDVVRAEDDDPRA